MIFRTRVAVVLAALSLGPLLYADNLIKNPGFETELENWKLVVPPEHEGAQVDLAVTKEDPHSGMASASLKVEEPVRCSVGSTVYVKTSPDERYRVRGWIKFSKDAQLAGDFPVAYIRETLFERMGAPPPGPLGNIHIGLTGDVARQPSIPKLGIPQLPSGWQKIEAVIEIPPDCFLMCLALTVHGVVGTVYWDDVSVELVPVETPLSKVLD